MGRASAIANEREPSAYGTAGELDCGESWGGREQTARQTGKKKGRSIGRELARVNCEFEECKDRYVGRMGQRRWFRIVRGEWGEGVGN